MTPPPTTSTTPPRWAVSAAHATALLVLPSGLWRIALALGHPAGYTAEGFADFQSPDARLWLVVLSVVSELLALLTIGLVRPWGEALPRRIPYVGGRAVPTRPVVVTAGLGALALTALWAGIPWWWTYPHDGMTDTGHLIVGILYQPLVLWGPLLAAVTLSYHRRRTGHRTTV
ncbi:hypothetical protein ACFY78_33260 [Streptomyces olindensis]|uniref:hypothetical protein n=1 Tax=Streptomyces olindensis TaxID=358823 RepID=UPI00368AB2A9